MSDSTSEQPPLSVGVEVGAVAGGRPETAIPRLYFYSLPNYHADRRFDARARGALECVLPYLDDYEAKLKKITSPGWYAVEERQGSKISRTWALEIRPDVRTIAPDARTSVSTADLSVVALVEQALEKQRELFAYELDALREELRPTEPPPPTVGSRLMERLEQVALDNMEKTLRGEQPPAKTEEAKPRLSAEEELTLTLAQNSDLLPRIIERMTKTLGVSEAPPHRRGVGERIFDMMEGSPVLQSKAGRTFERVVNRLLPDPDSSDDDDGDGDGDGDSQEEIADACSNYIVEKCAANEALKFTDEPIKRLAEEMPDGFAFLIHALQTSSIEMFVAHFSNPEEFPSWYASVLKAPHAHQWITENLVEPAKKLGKTAK
jgi:hypothetical protein